MKISIDCVFLHHEQTDPDIGAHHFSARSHKAHNSLKSSDENRNRPAAAKCCANVREYRIHQTNRD